jgi:SAM-dependent methyltransferase
VTPFDGRRIPFPDESFDLVYSSSVLEHVTDADALQAEIRRVLRRGGRALHVVPSAVWSIATLATWNLAIVRVAFRALRGRFGAGRVGGSGGPSLETPFLVWRRLPLTRRIRLLLLAPRHGEGGTALTEFLYFRRAHWRSRRERWGWHLERARGNGIFYTGNEIFGAALPIRARRTLARILGSACHVLVVRRA